MNDQYSELYSSYQWLVPTQFNIAQACAHRWAENPLEGRRIALFHETEAGHREVWTYSRLSDTANQLANGLVKMGVRADDRVAVVMARRPEALAATIAILSVGATVVPLAPESGADFLAACLQSADARVAIADLPAGPEVLQAQTRCPGLTQIVGLDLEHEAVIPWRSLLARQPTDFRIVSTSAISPAFLLYRPGPVSPPQGILLAHSTLIGALPGFVASQNWFPRKGDVFWSPAEWTSADGLFGALLPPLYFGHAVVGITAHFDPATAFGVLERYRITNTLLTTRQLQSMMHEFPVPASQFQLALRGLTIAGAAVPPALVEWCQDALDITANVAFGLPEMVYVMGQSYRKWPAKGGSMGRPYPGHRLAVLDANGQPCRAGAVGELALNRNDTHNHPDPALFLGYWRDDAATQNRYQGDWYLTGHLASVDSDGVFWHKGHKNADTAEHEVRMG